MRKFRLRIAALICLVAVGCVWGWRWHARRSDYPQPIPFEGAPPAGAPTASPRLDQPVSLTGAPPDLASLRAALKTANVMIVVLDAARADHFGCYGYPRDTTPNFDRLARESLVFDRHFCQYPHTTPSTTSLLTSQYPDTHGVPDALAPGESYMPEIAPDTFTIQNHLAKAGFETLLFTANVHASPALGIGVDFQRAYLFGRAGPTVGGEKGRRPSLRGRRAPETAREHSSTVPLLRAVQHRLGADPPSPSSHTSTCSRLISLTRRPPISRPCTRARLRPDTERVGPPSPRWRRHSAPPSPRPRTRSG